jgi:hypothetical protein
MKPIGRALIALIFLKNDQGKPSQQGLTRKLHTTNPPGGQDDKNE